MTILAWNVRGLNKPIRRRDVKKHIQSLSPSIVALLETKVKEQLSERILSYIPKGWAYSNNYAHSIRGKFGCVGSWCMELK